MKQSVVALVGISGVGKSTLLKAASAELRFQHLQASALIKEAKEAMASSPIAPDDLRIGDINDNQSLLIHGFRNARSPDTPLIVLDGHTVIDTPSGLVRIEPRVFAELGVTQFIFLADDPIGIGARREKDLTRTRPQRSVQELEDHQTQALLNAFAAARLVDAPLMVFTITQIEGVRSVLRSLADGE